MTGTLLAAIFSWGCKKTDKLGVTNILKQYAKSKGTSYHEDEIKKILERLFPYFYYQIIARSNSIADPFDLQVVKAHWIGNSLTEKIDSAVIKEVLKESGNKFDRDKLFLALTAIKSRNSTHHNSYTHHHPDCSVTLKDEKFFHLGKERLLATPQDINDFIIHGGK